jgi:REP element-mobilizing transposase RayT
MSELFDDKFRVSSNRLPKWNYTNPGIYFITIRTDACIHWFGKVKSRKIIFSNLGEIANRYWNEIPGHFRNSRLGEYVIMPNHMHGILILTEKNIERTAKNIRDLRRDVACNVSTANNISLKMSKISPKPGSLSAIIRSYKSAVTRFANTTGFSDFKWQSRFYDHIVYNKKELYQIFEYIRNNPIKWEEKYSGID